MEITTGDPDNQAVPEKVPAKYNVNSDLTADVGPKSNVLDFKLESK